MEDNTLDEIVKKRLQDIEKITLVQKVLQATEAEKLKSHNNAEENIERLNLHRNPKGYNLSSIIEQINALNCGTAEDNKIIKNSKKHLFHCSIMIVAILATISFFFPLFLFFVAFLICTITIYNYYINKKGRSALFGWFLMEMAIERREEQIQAEKVKYLIGVLEDKHKYYIDEIKNLYRLIQQLDYRIQDIRNITFQHIDEKETIDSPVTYDGYEVSPKVKP